MNTIERLALSDHVPALLLQVNPRARIVWRSGRPRDPGYAKAVNLTHDPIAGCNCFKNQ